MAIPTLAAIFLEINALVIGIMIVCLLAHEATAIWDVSYAYRTGEVTPTRAEAVYCFVDGLAISNSSMMHCLSGYRRLGARYRRPRL
jgi:hypothetical protein